MNHSFLTDNHKPMQQEDYSCDLTVLPTGAELRRTVSAIRAMCIAGNTVDDVRKTHLAFCQKYPKLVDKLMEPDMNPEQLEYILSMFDSVQKRDTSFEQASQTIGKSMFDKFVAPDLTPEQLSRVQKRMQELQTHSPEELAQAAAQLGQNVVSGNTAPTLDTALLSPPKKMGGGNKKKLRKRRKNKESQEAKQSKPEKREED